MRGTSLRAPSRWQRSAMPSVDEIKKIDPTFSDLQHNITVGSGTMYVVKSGDNLSNISKSFYGNPNEYAKIAQANDISNPDKIQVGQQLKIPAA